MKTSKIKAGGTEVTNSIFSGGQPPKKFDALNQDHFNEDEDDFDLSQDDDLDPLEDLDLEDDDDY